MALLRIDHTPESIKMNLPLNIILPDPGAMGDTPVSRRKVLYLLHGLSEDASAWQRMSPVEDIAREHGLVVVLPSGGRSFYTDQLNGQKYFTYLMEELPRYLKDVFALDPAREDTFIAGSSMGGYGALKAALLYPGRFSAVMIFSGVLSLDILHSHLDEHHRNEFTYLFGDLSKLPGSQHDPAVWLKNAARDPEKLPRLFITCGRQDDLYPLSAGFSAACRSLGIPVDYHEEDGKHDFSFWNPQLRRWLDLLVGQPAAVQEA
jgi:S-formylglutathione hydrolase FrmB